tara:strand:+ start:35 stop:943 length:909 start_codon:yes stop_codon:yes gene_type:complete
VTSRPAISVITVTWNLVESGRSDSIKETMECVQKQTCQNIEHIIWDGASTDGTIDLIQQKISEIKGRDDYVPIVFHSEPDVGLYDAMNKAVSASAGEYVIFLNSDDLLNDPDTLALALSHIVTSSPDFAFGRTRYINEDGSEFVSKRVTTDSILRTIPFCHNSMLFRRGAFLEFGGHDLEFKVVADYDLMLRLFLSGCRTQNIPETISVFRRGGISADVTRVGHEVAQVWRKNYGRFLDMSKYPDTALLHWYKIGQLPLNVSWSILRYNLGKSGVRRAAVGSFSKTFRRRLQPWRTWDNLTG